MSRGDIQAVISENLEVLFAVNVDRCERVRAAQHLVVIGRQGLPFDVRVQYRTKLLELENRLDGFEGQLLTDILNAWYGPS